MSEVTEIKNIEQLKCNEHFNPEEFEKIIKENERDYVHGFLPFIKFNSKLDKEIFDMLPVSDYDKERIILELYNESKNSVGGVQHENRVEQATGGKLVIAEKSETNKKST